MKRLFYALSYFPEALYRKAFPFGGCFSNFKSDMFYWIRRFKKKKKGVDLGDVAPLRCFKMICKLSILIFVMIQEIGKRFRK